MIDSRKGKSTGHALTSFRSFGNASLHKWLKMVREWSNYVFCYQVFIVFVLFCHDFVAMWIVLDSLHVNLCSQPSLNLYTFFACRRTSIWNNSAVFWEEKKQERGWCGGRDTRSCQSEHSRSSQNNPFFQALCVWPT